MVLAFATTSSPARRLAVSGALTFCGYWRIHVSHRDPLRFVVYYL
ncbi:MAG: hypothetical protein WBM75_04435 [Polyangiales bacterium]